MPNDDEALRGHNGLNRQRNSRAPPQKSLRGARPRGKRAFRYTPRSRRVAAGGRCRWACGGAAGLYGVPAVAVGYQRWRRWVFGCGYKAGADGGGGFLSPEGKSQQRQLVGFRGKKTRRRLWRRWAAAGDEWRRPTVAASHQDELINQRRRSPGNGLGPPVCEDAHHGRLFTASTQAEARAFSPGRGRAQIPFCFHHVGGNGESTSGSVKRGIPPPRGCRNDPVAGAKDGEGKLSFRNSSRAPFRNHSGRWRATGAHSTAHSSCWVVGSVLAKSLGGRDSLTISWSVPFSAIPRGRRRRRPVRWLKTDATQWGGGGMGIAARPKTCSA